MKKTNLILGFLITLLISIGSVNAWDFVSIDYGSTNLYTRNSMEIKSDGNPCFIFVNNDSELFYECWNGMSFYDGEVIRDISGYLDFGLALDNNDKPHICLVDFGNVLSYYSLVDSVLNETNLTTAGTPTSCSIDMDKNNKPHIVYNSLADKKHYEIFLLDDTWTTSIVKSNSFPAIYKYSVIKIATNDQKYVICGSHNGDPDDTDVIFANTSFESTSWQITIIDTSFNPETIGDMALYNNRAYISYKTDDGFNFSIQDSDSTNFTYPYSSADLLSLAVYQEITYGIYSTTGNMLLLTDFTGSFQVTTEFGSVNTTHKPTLEIDFNGNKWILYTAIGSNIVRLAYERPLYTISGIIYDSFTIDKIENAYICYDDGISSYCDYSNVNGDYEVNLFSNTYSVNISKSGYDDYSDSGIVISEDSSNINYYLNPEGTPSENQSSINILFINYESGLPETNLTIEFEYYDGCPALCGNKYYYSTNSEGRIVKTVYEGSYYISPMGDFLFYDINQGQTINRYLIGVGEDDYSNTFYVIEVISDITISGKVWGYQSSYDWFNAIELANASVIFYNDDYTFSDISNASGDYEIENVVIGWYNYICYKEGYLAQEGKIENDMGVYILSDSIMNFELINETEDTYKIYGNLYDQNNNVIPNVTVTIYDKLPASSVFEQVDSNSSGGYEIFGLNSGVYFITAQRDGFDQYYYIDEMTKEIKFFQFEILYSDIEYDITLINQSEIDYYCLIVNLSDQDGNPIPFADVSVSPKYHWSGAGSFSYKVKKTNSSGYVEICDLREEKYYIYTIYRVGFDDYKSSFYIYHSNYTVNINLTIYIPKLLVMGSVIECELSTPIRATIYFKNDSSNVSKVLYRLITEDGIFSSDQIKEGTYYLDIIPNEKEVYDNKTNTELEVIGDMFNVDYCLNRLIPLYTWGIHIYYKEWNNHTENYIFGGNVIGASISFIEESRLDFYSCETDETGYCSVYIPQGIYALKIHSVEYGLISKTGEDVITLNNHRADIFYYYIGGEGYTEEQIEEMGAKKRKAETEIQDFLYTYTPPFLMLMFMLFIMSAMNKVMVRG